MLDEGASYRHKQVMLEAYDQQCDEAARIFAEYHKGCKFTLLLHTACLKTLIARVDVRADAETLRYKSENNRVMEISSSDVSSPLSYQFNGNGKIARGYSFKGSNNQCVKQSSRSSGFMSETQNRLQGSADTVSSHSLGGGTSQNVRNLRQLELDVWGKEREAAGLRASLSTLLSEIRRLNKLCAERKEAEHSLKQKWKKIEEFDAVVADISKNSKDLIEKVSAFFQSPDNTLYMLPATPSFASAEKNAALLTARAGARDPSAIPSICAFLRPSVSCGFRGLDARASVLESLEFCLRLPINLVDIRQDLVESGRSLLSHAYHANKNMKGRTTKHCLDLATEQDNTITEKWLPELKTAVLNAQTSLEHCKYVWGLLDEWYEQPAATVVDWVTVDGQNVAA
ncbi:hypothetical protein Bca52824_061284 [Brassica carinata]|uniref:AUGMIN subunit 5 n=1 Tax=Brassica carinata TaxID=52824 RepID=A0A8X7UHJ1_BRACI|nr:hypothetical protein Bca52824_061284 [Brassica carinata]